MSAHELPYDPELARQVRAESLVPAQRESPPGLQTASDFRRQYLQKHRRLSDFHSRAEYLHAGLLEGDPGVEKYVPQPFRLRILGRWYTPDCYVQRTDGAKEVIELKPRGEMRRDQREPVEAFLAARDMRFVVTSNESVLARATEAENWLEIVRVLHQAGDEPFDDARYALEQRLWREGSCTLGELIDVGDRERTYPTEVSLFRLLHAGRLSAELTDAPLDLDTRIAYAEQRPPAR